MLGSHRAAVHFDPAAGGWINQSQLMSTGVHSPGTKAESGNGNLRGARPTSPPTASSKSYGIKLGPTEILMMNHQEKNPFSLPTCKQSAPARQAHPPFCIRIPHAHARAKQRVHPLLAFFCCTLRLGVGDQQPRLVRQAGRGGAGRQQDLWSPPLNTKWRGLPSSERCSLLMRGCVREIASACASSA